MTPVDVDALPLLLCGPMLRRVSPDSVSVFVVLKEHRWVQVKLYDHPDTFTPAHDFVDDPIAGLTFEVHDTVRLGRHFYVGMATTTLSGTDRLNRGQQYWYNVFLHETDDGTGEFVSLAQSEFHLLTSDNPFRIGFAQEHLPGFVVPPDDLTELNVVHGSCRKPHGGGIDMLASLDDLLAVDTTPVPIAKRPHLLVLGGDQIYADDVSPPLLRLIHDNAQALMGWEETLRGTAPHNDAADVVGSPLAALREQVAAWEADPIPLTEPAVELVEQLADLLEAAIEEIEWSDNWVENAIARRMLKWQLSNYEDEARDFVVELDPTLDPAVAQNLARKMLDGLILEVGAWFRTYRELFAPLSTANSWGRIALLQEKADATPLMALRAALFAVATSTSTGSALHAELTAAVDITVEGDDLRAWVDDTKALVAALAPLASDTPVIQGFVGAFRSIWFFNDPAPGIDDKDPGVLAAFRYIPSRIGPPQRGLELKEHAKFTSDAMHSHLMFVSEFYLMYAMAWSDVLWPALGPYASRNFVMPAFFESVPNYALNGPLGPSGLKDANETLVDFAQSLPRVRRVLANVPTLMMFDDHEVTDDWNLNLDWISNVNNAEAGVQVVRNAMVAYAVFQDWGNQPDDYADLPGVNRPLGRQLLDEITFDPPTDPSAPVDTPRLYVDDEGANLNSSAALVNWILGLGIEALTDLPGLTADRLVTTDDDQIAYRFVLPDGRKRWDWTYVIDVPAGAPSVQRPVRIISLDTRTHRGFPDELWAARVGITLDPKVEVGGRIAAAALIHGAELDTQLGDRLDPSALHLVVSPAPVFGLPLIEDLLQRYQVLTAGPEVADFESWQANPHGFGQLLTTLRSADCVLLSGDVHYGYSNLMTFPDDEAGAGVVLPPKLLLQLCSSSMKNETGLTQILGAVGRNGRLIDFIGPALGEIGEMIAAAFADLGETLGNLVSDLSNFGTWLDETAPLIDFSSPDAWATYYLKLKDSMLFSLDVPNPDGLLAVGQAMVAYIVGDLFNAEPGIAEREGFTMNFLKDVRETSERIARGNELTGVSPLVGLIGDDDEVEKRLGEMSEVVGYNNAGRVTFAGPGTSATDVQHELFWHPHGKDNKPFEPFDHQYMASTIHGDIPPLDLLPDRIVAIAREEYGRWHPPTGEIQETTAEGRRILRMYRSTMQVYDGRLDTVLPITHWNFSEMPIEEGNVAHWSAMFISYVMHRAQVGDLWFHSPRHIDYVRAAFDNRAAGNDNPFRLYHRDEPEAIVRVGDIVGGKAISEPQASAGVADGSVVGTHFDIVVAIHPPDAHRNSHHMHMIGGNVESFEPGADPNAGVTSNNRPRNLTSQGRLQGQMMWLIRAEAR